MVGSPQPHAHPWLQLLSQAFQNLAGASFCSTTTHPAPGWTPAELCIYLFLHFPSFPRTLAFGGVGGGEAEAGSQGKPKKNGGGRGAALSIPQRLGGSREVWGWPGRGWEQGAGRGEAGSIAHLLCLGKLKIAMSKEWLQAPQRAC